MERWFGWFAWGLFLYGVVSDPLCGDGDGDDDVDGDGDGMVMVVVILLMVVIVEMVVLG